MATHTFDQILAYTRENRCSFDEAEAALATDWRRFLSGWPSLKYSRVDGEPPVRAPAIGEQPERSAYPDRYPMPERGDYDPHAAAYAADLDQEEIDAVLDYLRKNPTLTFDEAYLDVFKGGRRGKAR